MSRFQRFRSPGWISLVLVLLLSSAAWVPLLHPGFLSTRAGGDSPFLLIRLDQLVRNLRAGVFPARWMPDAAYGLGYPFFNYYAALPYYLAAGLVLSGWGPITALKITQAIGFLASGTAMYALALSIFRRRSSAIIAAAAYVYAPFHLVNVYVRGDSLSEFYAFVWYPLLGWAILRLRERASPTNIVLLGGAYGGLILTHNISALIATPVAAAYALLLLASHGMDRPVRLPGPVGPSPYGENRARFLLAGLAGAVLGLGLSSWFWLPAILERDLVQLESIATGYFHFAGHFRGIDLLQRSWLFDYTISDDASPFCMGLVQTMIAGLGALALVEDWIRRRRIHPQGAFALVLLLVTAVCITPLSRPLWEHVPLLQLAQFPWRFLSLQALFTSFLAALLADRLLHAANRSSALPWISAARLVAGGAVPLLLLGSALGGLHPEWANIGTSDVTPARLRLYEYFTANIGTTVRWEYLPRTVETRPFTSAVFLNQGEKPPPVAVEGVVTDARLLDSGPTWETWEIAVTSPLARLAFHTHHFPGWRASVNGTPHPLFPVMGWGTIGLELPQGRHRVALRLGHTALQWAAELASLLALIIAMTLLISAVRRPGRHGPHAERQRQRGLMSRNSSRRIGLLVGLCLLAAIATGVWAYVPRLRPAATMLSQDLTMDYVRQPYLHHNPEGVRFGGRTRLLSYALSANEVQAGQYLTVTLAWHTTAQVPLTATVRLSAASQPLFDESPIKVKSTVPITAGRSDHRLQIPLSAVPGPYLLAVRPRDTKGTLGPLSARGMEMGTIYLRPVWVTAMGHGIPAQEALASVGESILLHAVEAERDGDERVLVHFTWEALRPIPANYNLSLRLSDPSGQQISVRDLQPFYGLYPTTLWPPGSIVEDTLSLAIPEDTLPGSGYALTVIVYPVSTLSPIGQAEVPVSLTD
jgi:hypothetical protein